MVELDVGSVAVLKLNIVCTVPQRDGGLLHGERLETATSAAHLMTKRPLEEPKLAFC